MRTGIASLVLALATCAPATARTTLYPGHYAGRTSNILISGARVDFEVDADGAISNLWCGCAAGSEWRVGPAPEGFRAYAWDPAVGELVGMLASRSATPTHIDGDGIVMLGEGFRVQLTWSAELVPELAVASSDAKLLEAEVAADSTIVQQDASSRPRADDSEREIERDDRIISHLSGRVIEVDEIVARKERRARPAVYGPPASAAPSVRAEVARLVSSAQRDARRIERRERLVRTALRSFKRFAALTEQQAWTFSASRATIDSLARDLRGDPGS